MVIYLVLLLFHLTFQTTNLASITFTLNLMLMAKGMLHK